MAWQYGDCVFKNAKNTIKQRIISRLTRFKYCESVLYSGQAALCRIMVKEKKYELD